MNRLAAATSPYLLQHADNPVDWYPWGEEALTRARDEDRPILLSIGYAACHWCHVMEHESFEDAATAAVMNDRFVNVKVDREERPDLDAVYMEAVVALTGQGGWPMTVFLTPAGEPFYGGTYYPPEPRHGLPSFRQVLDAIDEAWRERRDDVARSAAQLVQAVQQSAELRPSHEPLTAEILSAAARALGQQFEPAFGGWGRAPKFPNAPALEFLLRRGDERSLEMARRTLDGMAAGGMYDLVGGGFHRYSVDDRWLVPHFEKMLYDNALLASAYLHAWVVTGEERYRAVTEETIGYLLRELLLPEGGFASAQDADTDGVEGLTFTWTEEEGVPAALLEPFEHGRSIVRGELDPELRDRLFELRERRPKPLRDDKAIASWNGLALAALAEAGRRLERRDWLEAARRLGEFLLGPLSDADARLLRSRRDGRASGTAYLDDYANVAHGLLELHVATGDSAGCGRRTGWHGSRSSSSATTSTAASSSPRLAQSASSPGRRSWTTIRSRPGTRCSRTSSSGWAGSSATTSSSGVRSRCSGSSGRRSSAPRRRSAGRCARSTCTSARRGSWRSWARSTPRSRARRSRPGSRRRSSPSGRPRMCRCLQVKIS